MWGRKYTLGILLIFAHIFKASCTGSSSLTFAIDDTGSMTDDIAQVKVSANRIIDIVFGEKSSVIDNMVLVTINEPSPVLRTVTKDQYTLRRAINALYVHNEYNYDCPEPSMAGIQLALEKSNPGSYIYVFTDATSKDYQKSAEVIETCQRKQSQIVFVLTGYCYRFQDAGFQVFYDIAAACSGLAFYVGKSQVDQVLNTIQETIRGNKTVMAVKTVPAGVSTNIPFTIDEQTEYVIVSVSGSNVQLSISGPSAQQTAIMWTSNGKVMKLTGASVGQYVASVMGYTTTSVVVVGRTDFLFSHGFSVIQPKTAGETTSQPIANAYVYLSVLITDPKHLVDIKTAQILDVNGNVLRTMSLTKASPDFYITPQFIAPSQRFQIAVEGRVISSGNSIRRISKIPVSPQKPSVVQPDRKAPTITIVEGVKTEVEYNSTVRLTCKATAYPEPTFSWKSSNGVRQHFMSSILQLPYEYISYMTIASATKGDKYICSVSNYHGSDSKTIEVVVKDAFVVRSVPQASTGITYGTEGTITCNIQSLLPMNIRWYYTNDKTNTNVEIASSDKYWISADGTQLKIKKMDLDLVGKYTCKAALKNDGSIQKMFSTKVIADGIAAPTLSGENIKKANKRTSPVIDCKVIKGLPKPKITWQYMGASASKYTSLPGSDDVFRISALEEKHAGRYKCVAVNVLGSDEHVTTLIVQDPPKITSDSKTVIRTLEGNGLVKVPCEVTGLPKPTITWKKNGVALTSNAKYSIEAAALIIKGPKVSDSNSYTCETKNDAGTTSATFKVYVLQAPKVSGVAVKKVRLGTSDSVECTVVKGEPKPNITWQYMGSTVSKFAPLPGSTNLLRISIPSLEDKHSGKYKCVAANEVDIDEHVTKLIVEYAPKITSKSSIVYRGVESDLALKVPCNTIGVPKPDITWKLNGAVIKLNAKYAMEDGALLIIKPDENDGKSYTCEAKNYIGSATAVFKAHVDEYISFGEMHYLYLKKGETRKIKCDSYNSTSQSVRWVIGDNVIKVNDPQLVIEKATVSDDGNYTCRVSDVHGNTYTHTYVVDVGSKPTFLYAHDPVVDFRGEFNDVLTYCNNAAKPVANVTWTLDGKKLTDNDLKKLEDSFQFGRYSCDVKNVHGSLQRTFDVKSTACFINKNLKNSMNSPLYLNSNLKWPTWKAAKKYYSLNQHDTVTLSCPGLNNRPNAFQSFKERNLLKAVCVGQDSFLINGKAYKLSNVNCKNSVEPTVNNLKTKCLTANSELISVGFRVKDFLGTYDVCYDHAKSTPLYTRTLLTRTDGTPSTSKTWYNYPVGAANKIEPRITCRNSSSICCFGKSQLINDRVFNDRAAKESTFLQPLNTILYWRPCDRTMTTWEDIDDMVRTQILSYGDFVTWSGTHTLQDRNGMFIPRYLWKVMKFDEGDTLAIVHVNDASPTDKDIKCRNICTEDEQPWFTPSNKFTYCCSLSEFLTAFGLNGSKIGE